MVLNPIVAKITHFPSLEIWVNAKFVLGEHEGFIQNILKDVDHYFGEKTIKDDIATTLVETKIGQQDFIIKRINGQNFFTIIRRFFSLSRVEKNWKFAGILSKHGIETFIPIALVKKKCFGVCYLSYLYMSKIEGLEAGAYLESCKQRKQWQEVADNIIALINKLNNLGLRHRDLNLSNMIIYQKKPYLIDLDAMKLDKVVRQYLCKKEMARFIENIDYLKQDNNELFTYFYHALIKG
jgi:serine/threonine protein kinase